MSQGVDYTALIKHLDARQQRLFREAVNKEADCEARERVAASLREEATKLRAEADACVAVLVDLIAKEKRIRLYGSDPITSQT